MLHRFPTPTLAPLASLGDRAASDLSFIRSAMERSGRFTAVPGWGGVYMGVVALAATALTLAPGPGPGPGVLHENWPVVWVLAAGLACAGNVAFLVHKSRRQAQSLRRGRGPAFLLGLCPPLVAGAALTAVLWQAGRVDLLPQTWLLLYGAAVMTGGASSIPIVPVQGALFMVLGVVAAAAPADWGIPLLALGFGGLNLVFGAWIGVRHGG